MSRQLPCHLCRATLLTHKHQDRPEPV